MQVILQADFLLYVHIVFDLFFDLLDLFPYICLILLFSYFVNVYFTPS
jgi:hypothetical protein